MSRERLMQIKNKVFFSFLLLLLGLSSLNAQLVQLNLKFDKDTIVIGEATSLHLDIINQKGAKLSFFPLRDSLNKEIEVLDSLKNQTDDSFSLELKLTSFKPGQYSISGIPLVFEYDNNTDTIYSPELLLTVLSPKIDTQAEIRDIKPILSLPFRLGEIASELGIIIAIFIILVIIGVFIFRRVRKRNKIEEIEKLLPPHVIAIRDLNKLKAEKLSQNGKIKEYYSRLSDIMRNYLEKRFEIPAMGFVSSETLNSFNKLMPQSEMLSELLRNILQTADMVKFAKADPIQVENQSNIDNAFLFIEQTKIEEIVSSENKSDEFGKKTENIKLSEE